MTTLPIDPILENQTLKSEFKIRGLDLYEIWQPTPDDIVRENQELRYLLEFADKYRACRSRKKMEKMGYLFPPISFCIEPDSDWLRFRRWLQGKPIRKSLRQQLPISYKMKLPDSLSDEEIEPELRRLNRLLDEIGVTVDFIDELPPRLVYEYLWETLGEEFELMVGGGWHLDACSGYCPDCIRRPWCDSGGARDWEEDRTAGKIAFPATVLRFVSASPMSLVILCERGAEEQRQGEEFNKNNNAEI